MLAGLFGILRVSAVETKRRERDSNPRMLSHQQFSRLPQSTTLPSLRGENTAVARVDTNFFWVGAKLSGRALIFILHNSNAKQVLRAPLPYHHSQVMTRCENRWRMQMSMKRRITLIQKVRFQCCFSRSQNSLQYTFTSSRTLRKDAIISSSVPVALAGSVKL